MGNSQEVYEIFKRPGCLSYILITPAKDEAQFIELTIKSVISQTYLPLRWVIVSDGSTDGTDEIVRRYQDMYGWIELLCLPSSAVRHFGGKVAAFNAGYDSVRHIDHDIVGNLDADISFGEDYMEFLLGKFAAYSNLGVAGTPFKEGSQQYNYRFTSVEHVSGACQLFRRECFADIGGYEALKEGGIDLLAVIRARMKGWETRSFLEKVCVHHRRMGTGMHNGLGIAFKGGYHDYLMGVNIVWQIFRSIYQMFRKPFIMSGGAILAGYFWGLVTRADRIVPDEVIAFRRKEQLIRLKKYLCRQGSPKNILK